MDYGARVGSWWTEGIRVSLAPLSFELVAGGLCNFGAVGLTLHISLLHSSKKCEV